MSDVFNVEEVLEIACQIERNGARYYRRAAELVQHPEAVALLRELAQMEEDHEAAFTAMKATLATSGDLLGNADEVALMYLRAMAAGRVFPLNEDPAGSLLPDVTVTEVLRGAIGMEKDSIVYYLGIRDVMPEALGKDKVNMVIREEMRHVAILSDRLAEWSRA